MSDELHIVRLWDGFDGEWMDASEPMPKAEAEALCRKKNAERPGMEGREIGDFNDIDYYAVYPANTRLHFSNGRSMTR